MGAIRVKAAFYEIKIEPWSKDSANFLDVEVYQGTQWGSTMKLDYRPHMEASSLGVPLSPASGHPDLGV